MGAPGPSPGPSEGSPGGRGSRPEAQRRVCPVKSGENTQPGCLQSKGRNRGPRRRGLSGGKRGDAGTAAPCVSLRSGGCGSRGTCFLDSSARSLRQSPRRGSRALFYLPGVRVGGSGLWSWPGRSWGGPEGSPPFSLTHLSSCWTSPGASHPGQWLKGLQVWGGALGSPRLSHCPPAVLARNKGGPRGHFALVSQSTQRLVSLSRESKASSYTRRLPGQRLGGLDPLWGTYPPHSLLSPPRRCHCATLCAQ